MRILVTNDDGYDREALRILADVMSRYGEVTVVAPKTHQSGMSLAVTMGYRPIAVKRLSEKWWYLDGTPASCVKYGIDNIFIPRGIRPDLVVSGINYGANYATASLYSGTIGAAMEAAVNGIPAFGVSLDSFDPNADFSGVEALLPGLLDKLIPFATGYGKRYGEFYNINFPNLPADRIRGVVPTRMGFAHWENEYQLYDADYLLAAKGFIAPEEHRRLVKEALPGEEFYVMMGDFTDEARNGNDADHRVVGEGFISVTAHNIDNSDAAWMERLKNIL